MINIKSKEMSLKLHLQFNIPQTAPLNYASSINRSRASADCMFTLQLHKTICKQPQRKIRKRLQINTLTVCLRLIWRRNRRMSRNQTFMLHKKGTTNFQFHFFYFVLFYLIIKR